MKGLLGLLIALVVIVVVGLVLFGILNLGKDILREHEDDIEDAFDVQKHYIFEIENVIAKESDNPDNAFQSYFVDNIENEYCSDLKECILDSIQGNGEPCTVKSIIAFENSPIRYAKNYIDCNSDTIYQEIGDSKTKVCDFNFYKDPNQFLNEEDNDTNPFYEYEPYIHNCDFLLPPDDFELGISDYKEINEHFYTPPLSRGPNTINHGYNEDGVKINIVVTGADASNQERVCDYNLFVCSEPIIGSSFSQKSVKILDVFFKIIPQDLDCCGDYKSDIKVDKKYPRSYLFEFEDDEERPSMYQIIAAIDRGLWEWNKLYYEKEIKNIIIPNQDFADSAKPRNVHFSYAPWETRNWSSGISYSDCFSDDIRSDQTIRPIKEGPLIVFNDLWSTPGDLRGKFLNKEYDKLAITPIFYYHVIDSTSGKEVIITPRVVVCRDK